MGLSIPSDLSLPDLPTGGNDFLFGTDGPVMMDDANGVLIEQNFTLDFLAGNDRLLGYAVSIFGNSAGISLLSGARLDGNTGDDELVGVGTTIGVFGNSVGIDVNPSAAQLTVITGGIGNDRIQGTASGGERAAGIIVRGQILGGDGSDQIIGTATSGSLYSIGITNISDGFAGDRAGLIDGGEGNDTLRAEALGGSMSYGLYNLGGTVNGGNDSDTLIAVGQGGIDGIGIFNVNNILNPGIIDMGSDGDADFITGIGSTVGIRNEGIIRTGQGDDRVEASGADEYSGYLGSGIIELGAGQDTITGFGTQKVDGGDGLFDTAIIEFDLFVNQLSGDTVSLNSPDEDSIQITALANGATMSYTNVELFQFENGDFSLAQLVDAANNNTPLG